MATTINSYADELEDFIASGSNRIPSLAGGTTVKNALAVVTLASQASGEDIAVFKLPVGTTIVAGALWASATLANSATLAVGLMGADGSGYITADNTTTADDVAFFKAAAAQGTTLVGYALTKALGWNYTLEKDCYLTITTGTGTVATEVVWVQLQYCVRS